MPVMLTRKDWERLVTILRIFASGGCGGAHNALAIEAGYLAELLETQVGQQTK